MAEVDPIAQELKKVANLLALRQVADLTKGEAAAVLAVVGFSTREMAALLGTSESSIRGLLSAARKKAGTE